MTVGVIGAGNISKQYLANMGAFPDLDVRFVADLLPERAKAMAERFGVARHGTVEELLADDAVELIVNLTIPAAHAEVAAAVLAAGKHVWNEKPLALDLESASTILAQADAAGLLVGCAPDTFLGPGWQTVRRLVDRGDIGEPLTASVVMQYAGPHHWHPNPEFLFQTGGGPLLDIGPYYLTVLVQLFGSISSVAARGASASPTRTIFQGDRAGEVFEVNVPTYVTAIFDFEHGAIASTTFSFDSPLTRVGVVELAGSEATLAGPDPNNFGGDIRIISVGDEEWDVIPVTGVEGGRGIGVVDMARALRSGGEHRATGRLALHVLDAMLATADSIEQRAFVAVDSRVDAIEALPDGWDPTRPTI